MIVKNGKAKDDDDGKGDEREAALLVVVLFDVEGSLSPSLYPPIPVPLTQYLFQTSGAPKRSASLSENVRSMHFIRSLPPVNPPALWLVLLIYLHIQQRERVGRGGKEATYRIQSSPRRS